VPLPPLTVSELNLDWLNQILLPVFKTRITDFSCENVGAGVGILSDVIRVHLQYEEKKQAPASVIAKFSASSPDARSIANDFNFYEAESLFYNKLSHQIPVSCPECYFNYFNPDQGMVILMSDVKGKGVDQLVGCTLDQTRSALTAMAAYHAWGYNNVTQNFPWLRQTSNAKIYKSRRDTFSLLGPLITANLTGKIPDWLEKIIPDLCDLTEKYTETFIKYPETLLHGDFRADNLIFDGDTPAIIDWQITLRGNGAYDVAMFLSQSIDPELRRRHFDELIRHYLETLQENGVKADEKDFMYLFRLAAASCLTNPLLIGGMIDENIPRTRQLAETLLSRACRTVEDLDCFEFFIAS